MADQVPYQRGGELSGQRPSKEPELFVDGSRAVEVFRILRRHLWLVLSVALVTFAPVLYLVLKQPSLFQAVGLIRIGDARQALTGGLGGSTTDDGVSAKADLILSQLEVLKGRRVLGQVVDFEGLRLSPIDPEFPPGLLHVVQVDSTVRSGTIRLRFDPAVVYAQGLDAEARAPYGAPFSLGGVRFAVRSAPAEAETQLEVISRESAIDRLEQNMEVEPRARTDAVAIRYTAADPVTAQRVVNRLIEVFQLENARAAQEQARQRRIFLDARLRSTDSVLAETRYALSNFRRRERVFNSAEQISAQQEGLMNLDVRREEMNADRQMYQTLLTALQREGGAGRSRSLRTLVSSPEIAANPVISQLYQQLVQYEAARDSLSTGALGITADHPDLQRMDALIASTQSKLVDAVGSHIASLQARIGALDNLRARNSAQIQQLPPSEAEEARLAQQVETMGRIEDQIREELQKARVAEAVESGQVEVIYPAPLPSTPVNTRRELKLVLGLFLGLLLGTGAAFVREAANTSIRRPADLEATLDLPGLATVPRLASGRTTGWPSTQKRLGSGRGQPDGLSSELVALSEMGDPGAEAYKTLRTNLLFSQATRDVRTLIVTSASPMEGKTTTAANLAVSLAQQGKHIVLVDCDLRRPRLHQIFDLPREPGLTDILLDRQSLTEILRPTPVQRLLFIPGGALASNAAELLGSERMRELLEQLSEKFDLVVLDTPPLLAASDASVLGSEVDGVLLVVRAGQTDRAVIRNALQQLTTVGARVIGAVLNDPDERVPRYGGYQYYKYYASSEA